MVTHTCNPSYLGDGDQKDGSWFKAGLNKKLAKTPQPIKAGSGGTCPSSQLWRKCK
jgi:hypothetical protein